MSRSDAAGQDAISSCAAPTGRPAGITRLLSPEFVRYFGASVVALMVDAAILMLLARLMHYAWAAVVGFLVGSLVHYLISVRFVFRRRRLAHRRWMETVIFFAVGAVALGVNVGTIVAAVEWGGLPLLAAKLVAAGVSFLVAYGGRKALLFR